MIRAQQVQNAPEAILRPLAAQYEKLTRPLFSVRHRENVLGFQDLGVRPSAERHDNLVVPIIGMPRGTGRFAFMDIF